MSRAVIIDSSWTSEATAVVLQACEHFGGLARFRELSKIRLFPERLSGLVPWLKGVGVTFPLPSLFEISPQHGAARFVDYPERGRVGIFERGAVRIEHSEGGLVIASNAHRDGFRGPAKMRRWSPLDALYFFGYALTHYHSLPFTLLDGRLIGMKWVGPKSAPVSVLSVELPVELHTHCRRQRFYFDAQGKLLRHDYHAQIIGLWARGAHFWNRQTRCNGFPIALDRQVMARVGSLPVPVTALHATFRGAEVEYG